MTVKNIYIVKANRKYIDFPTCEKKAFVLKHPQVDFLVTNQSPALIISPEMEQSLPPGINSVSFKNPKIPIAPPSGGSGNSGFPVALQGWGRGGVRSRKWSLGD